MQFLSTRLQTIYDMVPMGAKLADIGTDHAYLPIALSKSGKAIRIIACDINESPLNKAKENIARFGISNIETRLGNGLSPIEENEVNTIVIAGMGGEVIKGILSSWKYTENKEILFLLQPMTSAEVLRLFLMENGFNIEKEIAVKDNSKIYSVLAVRFSGTKKEYPAGYEYVGELKAKTDTEKLYIHKQLKRLESCFTNISALPNKQTEAEKLKLAISNITKILED